MQNKHIICKTVSCSCRTIADKNVCGVPNTVEPLYNGHHWEPTFCPLIRGVPNSGASGIFPVGVLPCKWAVEHGMAAFSELSFAVCWGKAKWRLILALI